LFVWLSFVWSVIVTLFPVEALIILNILLDYLSRGVSLENEIMGGTIKAIAKNTHAKAKKRFSMH